MNKGDLVRPKMTCGGNPGAIRSNLAILIESSADTEWRKGDDVHWIKALCSCGTVEDYSWHFKKLEEADVAYSADPM